MILRKNHSVCHLPSDGPFGEVCAAASTLYYIAEAGSGEEDYDEPIVDGADRLVIV